MKKNRCIGRYWHIRCTWTSWRIHRKSSRGLWWWNWFR